MSVPHLPPPVDIDNDTKKGIIDGLKKVLAAFQEAGLVPAEVSYQALISDPKILSGFVETFQKNQPVVDAIVVGKDGAPVHDLDAPLACGVSLNQIQQLLVRTCAKKVFEADKPMETVTETVTKTSMFGLIKKVEHIERQAVDPVEERKVREISRYVAFGWQLPLLEHYRKFLTYAHVMELGEDLLGLSSPKDIEAVSKFEPALIKKVKQTVGPDFIAILADRPNAIAGIAVWNRDMYEFYRKTLGDHAWAFFAREKAFFNVVAALDKPVAKIFGDVLCYIHADNLMEFQRLNIDKTEVLVVSLKAAFGNRLPQVLGHPAFAKDILRKTVDNLLHMNQEKDKLMASFALTCKAMVPTVNEWLAKQPRA